MHAGKVWIFAVPLTEIVHLVHNFSIKILVFSSSPWEQRLRGWFWRKFHHLSEFLKLGMERLNGQHFIEEWTEDSMESPVQKQSQIWSLVGSHLLQSNFVWNHDLPKFHKTWNPDLLKLFQMCESCTIWRKLKTWFYKMLKDGLKLQHLYQ